MKLYFSGIFHLLASCSAFEDVAAFFGGLGLKKDKSGKFVSFCLWNMGLGI